MSNGRIKAGAKRISGILGFREATPESVSSHSSHSSSSFFEFPPLSPLTLQGYKPTVKHRLLDQKLGEEIRPHLPSRLQINHNWTLLYSLEQNGASLHTMYNLCKPQRGAPKSSEGYLLIIKDNFGGTFGAYMNEFPKTMEQKRYYGNGDCFLWKSHFSSTLHLSDGLRKENPDKHLCLKVYPYTSLNDFIMYSNSNFFSIGSGDGKFGLWIDDGLNCGASDSVETFGNEPLSRSTKFQIIALEVWRTS